MTSTLTVKLPAAAGVRLGVAVPWLILHGRYVCKARKPDCGACIVRDLCAFDAKVLE